MGVRFLIYFSRTSNSFNTLFIVLINSLRGYPLKGVEMKLPENLQGIVFRENEQLKIEEAERELKFGGKFDSFTYWNYDRNPTENDAYKKLTHYLKTSEAVSWLLNDCIYSF